jgi:hypothetical protein
MPAIEQLRAKREEARTAAAEILGRAQEEQRDLSAEEAAEHRSRLDEVAELDRDVEEHLEKQIAEVRAQATREPEVERRTLADRILERGWDLKKNPSVTIPADELVETRAQSLPAVSSWARRPGVIVPLGQDQRFLFPNLPTESAGESSTVLDFKQSARTLTGSVNRVLSSVAAKATLEVTVAAVTEDLQQFAVVLPAIPNQILESIPAFTDYMNNEGSFQISKALDDHVLAQIVAATPAFGTTGTTIIEQIRNGIATMRATGANPTLTVLNPTDAATLELTADAGGFVFASRDTGTASPLWGTTVIERIGGGTDPKYLLDPEMLGRLYIGSMRFDADPYTGFAANTTALRVEVNALYHVRNVQGARRVNAT